MDDHGTRRRASRAPDLTSPVASASRSPLSDGGAGAPVPRPPRSRPPGPLAVDRVPQRGRVRVRIATYNRRVPDDASIGCAFRDLTLGAFVERLASSRSRCRAAAAPRPSRRPWRVARGDGRRHSPRAGRSTPTTPRCTRRRSSGASACDAVPRPRRRGRRRLRGVRRGDEAARATPAEEQAARSAALRAAARRAAEVPLRMRRGLPRARRARRGARRSKQRQRVERPECRRAARRGRRARRRGERDREPPVDRRRRRTRARPRSGSRTCSTTSRRSAAATREAVLSGVVREPLAG